MFLCKMKIANITMSYCSYHYMLASTVSYRFEVVSTSRRGSMLLLLLIQPLEDSWGEPKLSMLAAGYHN